MLTPNKLKPSALHVSRWIGVLLGAGLVLALTIFSACDELITNETVVILELKSEFVAVCPDGTVSDTGCAGCAPFTVIFQDVSKGIRAEWSWNFGDGNISTEADPTHTFDSSGLYRVSLRITYDSNGIIVSDIEIKNRFIFVGQPVTGFTVSDSVLVPGDSVKFTPFPDTGFAQNWLWEFGDGGSSTLRKPTHVYNTTGTFDIKLSAICFTDSAIADTTEIVDSALIRVVQEPVVTIVNVQSFNICAPTTVTFIDSTPNPLPSIIQSRVWDFGNGQSSIAQQFTASYALSGTYWAKLTVTTNLGGKATDSVLITVNEIPTAIIGVASDTVLCIGQNQQVSFKDSSLGTIVSRLWEFGDGQTATQADPVHSYSVPGSYTVTLTIQGTCDTGAVISFPNSTVRNNLVVLTDSLIASSAGFSLSAVIGDTNTVFTMTDITSGFATYWHWIFNDTGQIGFDNSEQFRFTVDGTYEIKMYVRNTCMIDSVFATKTVIVSTP